MSLSYRVQRDPKGIPDAFIVGRDFVGTEPVALILGDNIFFGSELSRTAQQAVAGNQRRDHIHLSGQGPERLGRGGARRSMVAAVDIEEKPAEAEIQSGGDGPVRL